MIDKQKELNEKKDIEWLLETVQGRRIVWRFLTICGVYHDIAGEQIEVYRALGRRSVGLQLLDICSNADEGKVFLMMKEAQDKATMEDQNDDRSKRKPTDRDIISGNYNPDDLDAGGHISEADRDGDTFGIV